MCNNNNMLKTHNIGNGTIARVKSIKLKSTAPNPIWKNWEGYKVLTVNARHVEYVEIERFPDNAKIAAIKKSIHELEADMIGPRGPSRFSAAVIGGLGGALLTL